MASLSLTNSAEKIKQIELLEKSKLFRATDGSEVFHRGLREEQV